MNETIANPKEEIRPKVLKNGILVAGHPRSGTSLACQPDELRSASPHCAPRTACALRARSSGPRSAERVSREDRDERGRRGGRRRAEQTAQPAHPDRFDDERAGARREVEQKERAPHVRTAPGIQSAAVNAPVESAR